MRRTFRYLSFILFLMMLISSCTDPKVTHVPGTVTVHISDTLAKTIGYDGEGAVDGSKDINGYLITVSEKEGDDSVSSGWIDSSNSSWTISGLRTGRTYVFSADAGIRMTDGTAVVISEAEDVTVDVTDTTSDVSLAFTLLRNAEAEYIELSITPPVNITAPVTYSFSLDTLDGTEIAAGTGLSADGSNKLVLSKDDYDLSPGSRILQLTATGSDGNTWTVTDAVRLLPDLPARGTISFKAEDALDDIEIGIEDAGGEIIFDGMNTSVSATLGDTFTITLPEGILRGLEGEYWWLNANGVTIGSPDVSGKGVTAKYDASNATMEWTIATTDENWVAGQNILTIMVWDGTPFGAGSVNITVELY